MKMWNFTDRNMWRVSELVRHPRIKALEGTRMYWANILGLELSSKPWLDESTSALETLKEAHLVSLRLALSIRKSDHVISRLIANKPKVTLTNGFWTL
jgi:hypothetical protein